MRSFLKICVAALLVMSLTGCSGNDAGAGILLVLAALVMVVAVLRTRAFIEYCRRRKKMGRKTPTTLEPQLLVLYGIATVLLILGLVFAFAGGREVAENPETTETQPTEPVQEVFQATGSPDTDPDNRQIRWEVFDGGNLAPGYVRENPISFGDAQQYFSLPGISTFRGNNYRNGASYGTAAVTEKKLSTLWTHNTGVIPGGSWSGNGWTGQPLIVQWDHATKQIMNLHPEKKSKENLKEVIYASLDGVIYFLDLDDGSETRPSINIGLCFKGAGTLDPRGYPLLYVGAGDENAQGERPRMFIISLIDGKILYQYGHADELAYRRDNEQWCAFDSAPLIHGETDTLIWPGENGNLYTIGLNTDYDKTAGTISVNPNQPVLTRYLTERTGSDAYWCGYEASACIVENYLYVSENGGMFFCVDLNTMELVWAQDTKDDSNSTPVFQKVSDTEGYLYTAPSLHWTKDKNNQGTIAIYKLDAVTGQILWEKPYDVYTVSGVSGGVQSSPALGREGTELEGMIFYGISRTKTKNAGTLVALDTETGQEIWKLEMENYAWSSPVDVYDENGNGYLILCDSGGTVHFIDGKTGKVESTLYIGGLVEASPAVYDNTVVVGTRLRKIYSIRIK